MKPNWKRSRWLGTRRFSTEVKARLAGDYHVGSPHFPARLAQKLRGLFGRCGVDIETGSPFKSRRLGQFGHEFNVPVVILVGWILRRRRVHDQVVRWIVEYAVRFHQKELERFREILEHVRRRVLKRRLVALGENPGFKGKPRSIRSESQKIFVLSHHSDTAVSFLPDGVAKNAALFVDVILFCSLQF